jgi:hypothetical protein
MGISRTIGRFEMLCSMAGATQRPSVTPSSDPVEASMTERRFVLVDFRYTNDVGGHVRLFEADCTYAMRQGLAHTAAKRELVTTERPVDWMPPSIFRPLEVVTEMEAVEAEKELKALQRHAFEIVDPDIE